MALVLWQLGYPEQALRRAQETLSAAQKWAHHHTLATALAMTANLHLLRREVAIVHQRAEALRTLATEQEFPYWGAQGMIMWGWALAAQGQAEEGLPHMHEGLAALQATGAESRRPWYLGYLAEAYSRSGQTATALGVLKQALEAATTMQQQLAQAQLYRLKGEVLMQADSKATMVEAEENLRQSLALARRQHAKAWELRAAMSLARLWQRQDKPATARQLLVEVYNQFSEGFDTADLRETQELLDQLP